MQYMTTYSSPLGEMTLASDGTGLAGLWFQGQKYFPLGLTSDCQEAALPIFETVKSWLDSYFAGNEPEFTPPLSLTGSPFRRAVWEILLEIPYGHTMTYGQIAARLAAEKGLSRMSAQAVGGAVGHNPVSIIVPCHRVVGTGGNLTGYTGGVEKKFQLLRLEKVDMSGLFLPKGDSAL